LYRCRRFSMVHHRFSSWSLNNIAYIIHVLHLRIVLFWRQNVRPSHLVLQRLLWQIMAAGIYRYNSGLKIILFNIYLYVDSLVLLLLLRSSSHRPRRGAFECSLYIILLWSSDRRATEAVRFLFYGVYIK